MAPRLRLGVNIDHVATIRNARGGHHPDPVKAAELAIASGADTIDEVGARCGAGIRCGGCHPYIKVALEVRAAAPEVMVAA